MSRAGMYWNLPVMYKCNIDNLFSDNTKLMVFEDGDGRKQHRGHVGWNREGRYPVLVQQGNEKNFFGIDELIEGKCYKIQHGDTLHVFGELYRLDID